VAMVAGYLPCAFFDLSPWIALLGGSAILILILRVFGRHADEPQSAV